MLGRELVLLLEALVQNKVDNIKAAREAIAEGILQLSEYLKHLNERLCRLTCYCFTHFK